ncbi:hypothetical protein pb186bvf_010667 [Paramecium bursaria]
MMQLQDKINSHFKKNTQYLDSNRTFQKYIHSKARKTPQLTLSIKPDKRFSSKSSYCATDFYDIGRNNKVVQITPSPVKKHKSVYEPPVRSSELPLPKLNGIRGFDGYLSRDSPLRNWAQGTYQPKLKLKEDIFTFDTFDKEEEYNRKIQLINQQKPFQFIDSKGLYEMIPDQFRRKLEEHKSKKTELADKKLRDHQKRIDELREKTTELEQKLQIKNFKIYFKLLIVQFYQTNNGGFVFYYFKQEIRMNFYINLLFGNRFFIHNSQLNNLILKGLNIETTIYFNFMILIQRINISQKSLFHKNYYYYKNQMSEDQQSSARGKLQKAVFMAGLMVKRPIQDEEMYKANKALIKPFHLRSRDDIDVIERVMVKVKWFTKLKLKYGLLVFKEVCKRAQPEQTIIQINKEGTTFYIILRGKVSINIYLPKYQKRKGSFRNTLINVPLLEVDEENFDSQEINTLGPGESFGEISLLDPNTKTTANVITKEITEFACLDKEQFLNILGALNQAEMNEKMNFVRGIHFLQGWFDNDLKTLSFHFECICFERKEYIFMEQDSLDGFLYFLKKGEVVLTKKINKQNIQVCRLVVGEMFGEEIFTNQEYREFSAQATEQDTQIYKISKQDLEKRMWQNNSRQQFKESVLVKWRWRMQRLQDCKKQEETKEEFDYQTLLKPKEFEQPQAKTQNGKISSTQVTRDFNFMEPTSTMQYLQSQKKEQKSRMKTFYNKDTIIQRQNQMSLSSQKTKDISANRKNLKRINISQMKQHLIRRLTVEIDTENQFNFVTDQQEKPVYSRQSSQKVLFDEISQFMSSKNYFHPSDQKKLSVQKRSPVTSFTKKRVTPQNSYEIQETKTSLQFKRIFQF